MFLLRATQRGWIVSQPFAEKQCYDFIIDNGRDRLRVQVKSTEVPCSPFRYHINLGRGSASRSPYKKSEIDFFAIYVIPDDSWFILSVEAAAGRVALSVPMKGHIEGSPCQPHHEAWSLMDWNENDGNGTLTIHACASFSSAAYSSSLTFVPMDFVRSAGFTMPLSLFLG
jgi:hypothetical protein